MTASSNIKKVDRTIPIRDVDEIECFRIGGMVYGKSSKVPGEIMYFWKDQDAKNGAFTLHNNQGKYYYLSDLRPVD